MGKVDPTSQASGLSHETPRPGRSSPSKTINEDMSILKGQLASMQDATMISLHFRLLASIPSFEKGDSTGESHCVSLGSYRELS